LTCEQSDDASRQRISPEFTYSKNGVCQLLSLWELSDHPNSSKIDAEQVQAAGLEERLLTQKLGGRGTGELALIQRVSRRRVEQLWQAYRLTGVLPALKKAGRPRKATISLQDATLILETRHLGNLRLWKVNGALSCLGFGT
jgi:hypothetical protein